VDAVAALQEVAPTRSGPSCVLPAEAPAVAPAPTKDVLVRNARRRDERYKVISYTARSLVLEGKGALPENVLTMFEIEAQPPFSLAGVTVACASISGSHRIVIAPFALSAESARRLRELTKG
jgi:hypothetical protein